MTRIGDVLVHGGGSPGTGVTVKAQERHATGRQQRRAPVLLGRN
jgi:hypothetical protein